MAKVFTLFQNVPQDQDGWFISSPINSAIIDGIDVQDTDGKKQPTSIPSPFAQIDLVRAAFKKVVHNFDQKNDDLNLTTDAHRLVSNALDIGQLFFEFEKHRDSLKVIVWDINKDLSDLLNSQELPKKRLGETLKLFLKSGDAESNNFDILQKVYILSYNNQVIGATSPKTLFFASADALNVGVEIDHDNDTMLDDQPLALYKRNKDFIKYLFFLKNQPEFALRFPEINDYLSRTFDIINRLDNNYASELLDGISPADFNNFQLPNSPGLNIEILPGFPMLSAPKITIQNSDFFIQSDKVTGQPPMVLPTGSFNRPLRYVNQNWQPNTVVPKNDPLPLDQRKLPRVQDLYPYLTEGDFLEDTIIKLPYKIDDNRYLTLAGCEEYLLPINKRLFDYFSAEDLLSNGMISARALAGEGIEVQLSIPIQRNEQIVYSRVYTPNNQVLGNSGYSIQDAQFTLGIYPFVKSKKIDINYSIAIASLENHSSIEKVLPIKSSNNQIAQTNKRPRAEDQILSDHYLVNGSFDVLEITADRAKGVIIPKMRRHNSSQEEYSFAIDFGTTNTHIEYLRTNVTEPKAFEHEFDHLGILRNKSQEVPGVREIQLKSAETLLRQELVPSDLGKKNYEFPFRSVVLENRSIDFNTRNYLYGDINIGFDYQRVSIKEHLTRHTNLKWLNMATGPNQERVKMFIRQVLELCRNFVLESNGNVNNTNVTWLYPTSMSYVHRTALQSAWEEQFKLVFPKVSLTKINAVPESIAPFYYYQSFEGLVNQTRPTVSIDVGGGTSDLTIFEGGEPLLISSFRFAGNSIFGDGYNNSINNNGFVKRYYPKIINVLNSNTNKTVEEIAILEAIRQQSGGDDLSNFLFSLKDNFNLKTNDIDIDYHELLSQDDDLKIVFLLFYLSSVYHLAQLMKSKGLDLPQHIIYSGTAAKSLYILDKGLGKITRAFNEVFNIVYGVKEADVKVQLNESPKVLTAKGALMIKEGPTDIENLKFLDLGFGETNIETLDYQDIEDDHIKKVVSNVASFHKLVDHLNDTNGLNFNTSFGVSHSSMNTYRNLRESEADLVDFIKVGVAQRIKSNQNNLDLPIEETLFFYPFIGLLHKLASEAVENA